ncbi:MAG: hypothetical protein KatS3mg109_1704 [Pirellulaceae bacterium]|nr:MAG: hypothetical protein KatS3mg109_1704 [Pirellulaceae bacterium]GIW96275.1 MAG: hypothetical protein KatS3mg110_4316 [Pirellulaceae bacterium]
MYGGCCVRQTCRVSIPGLRWIFLAAAILYLSLGTGWSRTCNVAAQTRQSEDPIVVFYAVGDSPYVFFEVPLLAAQVQSLPADGEFLVHLGDIKLGAAPCEEAVYRDVARLLRRSPRPVFIVPGDNEWNDCRDPREAWQLWSKYFLRFEEQWHPSFPVVHQSERPENFAFQLRHVLFVGLNLVGGTVHDPSEWRRRHQDNSRWLETKIAENPDATHCVVMAHALLREPHQDFVEALRRIARRFSRPMLYLHGDGHAWIFDQPFGVPNVWRIQVDRGGLAPPVQIRIHQDSRQPFQYDRRLRAPGSAP